VFILLVTSGFKPHMSNTIIPVLILSSVIVSQFLVWKLVQHSTTDRPTDRPVCYCVCLSVDRYINTGDVTAVCLTYRSTEECP
jgi:hypothetical protein